MANRIKGITIDIGANTVPLTDALKEADKSLKSTQTQLNDVNRLLKLDPKNVELLSQKHKLLTSAIKDTNDKLKQEREALKQLADSNDGSDKAKQQMEALKREIIATEEALKKFKDQARDTSALGILSNSLAEASEKTKLLSATAVTALTGMTGMAVKAGAMADDLNTLSKQTGFTTEELQKMQYAADRIDVSVDTITGGLQKLTVQVKNGNDAFDTLGVKLTDASGNTRSMTDIFYDTVEALSHIENETDRDTMAMELFGKSASSLAGIVDDGGAALRQFGEEAENAGLILSQDAIDAANAFNDKVDELKAKAQAAFFESGAAIAESFIPAMEKLVEVGTNVLQFVANMDTGTIQLVTTVLALTAALTPVLKALSVGIGLINNVGTLINGLTTTVIPAVSSAMAAGSAGMIAALSSVLPVIAAIAVALAGVIALIDYVRQSKIDKDWDNYLNNQTANKHHITEQQARNWMNKDEIQTIIDPSGQKQYYINNSDWNWQKNQAAINGYTDDVSAWGDNAVNMTVNVDHINDLQDLIDISQQAQLTTRMGG